MAKVSKNEIPVTEEMLEKFEKGQVIVRYCFYSNITFQEMDGDHVIMHDVNGTKKRDPKWLFLKHARIAK